MTKRDRKEGREQQNSLCDKDTNPFMKAESAEAPHGLSLPAITTAAFISPIGP